MTDCNPFSRSATHLNVGGWPVQVPHRVAGEWMSALFRCSDPGDLLMRLISPADTDLLFQRLVDGRTTAKELHGASYEMIRRSCPYREWWKSVRLMVLSAEPDVCGRTATAGLDPWTLTAGQWVTGVYAMITEGVPKDKLFQFDSSLEMVPPGVEDDTWGTDDFDAMVRQARMMPGMR